MIRLVCVVLALVLGLAFHSRNHQAVTLNLYVRSADMPLSWAVVAALIVGALLGILALLPRLIGVQRALHREQKRARILHSEPPSAKSAAGTTALPQPEPKATDGH
jgi:putative membrane protein